MVKAQFRYDARVDDLMETFLKDSYKGKYQHRFPTYEYKSTTEESTTESVTRKAKTNSTLQVATTHVPRKYEKNMTREEYFMRKRYFDLKVLIDEEYRRPNFKQDDEISLQTRRFNKIKQSEPEALRELYYSNEEEIKKGKPRAIALMEQFVYETRYQLPHAQLLRNKYKNSIKYQIGYCFALIKDLKRQQMVMFSTLKFMHKKYIHLYSHLKLYEKVVRLDVDIKDLVRYIMALHNRRLAIIKATTTTTDDRDIDHGG